MTPSGENAGGLGSLLTRVGRGWQTFWHAEQSPLALGLFRIVFACCLFREVATTRAKAPFAIEGGFHLPYLSFIPFVSENTYHWIHLLQYPFIILLGLGLMMRLSCGALLGLQGYVFFADQLNFRNHPYLFLLILLALLFSPADESVSLKSFLRKGASLSALIGPDRPVTCQRLIQMQVCIVYFYAALHKIHPMYLRGDVLGYQIEGRAKRIQSALEGLLGAEAASSVVAGLQHPDALLVASFLTVGLELFLPFALWFRRTRPIALATGIPFHLTIAFLMSIQIFSYTVIGSYFLFLDPRTLPRVLGRLSGSPVPPAVGGRAGHRVSS